MTAHRYRPATTGWLALCRADLVLAVDLASADPRATVLWDLISSGGRTADLLDELTRAGISATPSFALVDRSSSVRVLVRGNARVQVAGGSVDGRQSSGWAEASATASDTVIVEVSAGESAELPISHGAVRVSRIATGAPATGGPAAAPLAPIARAKGPAHAASSAPGTSSTPEVPSDPVDTTISATTIVQVTDEEPVKPRDSDAADGSAYDHLFGETMHRSVEDAAVRPPDAGATSGSSGNDDDRVDERTIVAADLATARANRRATRRKPAAGPAAPPLYLDLSTGTREPLDRPLVIGRAPTAERVSDGNVPRLVSMTTPNQDISRTHVQVAVEGGTVVVTDLHSRNGTMVQLPGKAPQQLRAGEPTPVTVGTIVDLGDGATLTVGEES